MSSSIPILPLVKQSVFILVRPLSFLMAILKLSLVAPFWIFENAVPFELVSLVETTLVLILLDSFNPMQFPLHAVPIFELSLESVIISLFLPLALKSIISEITAVLEVASMEVPLGSFSAVILKGSTVIAAIREYVGALSFSPAIHELPNVYRTIVFIEFSPSFGNVAVLLEHKYTSLISP